MRVVMKPGGEARHRQYLKAESIYSEIASEILRNQDLIVKGHPWPTTESLIEEVARIEVTRDELALLQEFESWIDPRGWLPVETVLRLTVVTKEEL